MPVFLCGPMALWTRGLNVKHTVQETERSGQLWNRGPDAQCLSRWFWRANSVCIYTSSFLIKCVIARWRIPHRFVSAWIQNDTIPRRLAKTCTLCCLRKQWQKRPKHTHRLIPKGPSQGQRPPCTRVGAGWGRLVTPGPQRPAESSCSYLGRAVYSSSGRTCLWSSKHYVLVQSQQCSFKRFFSHLLMS